MEEKKKLKAVFVNGSPRKNKNTALALQSAMRGAEETGAEVELVHLYDIDFKGCKSCFACKVKNSKTNGVCALKDDLRPVLERCREADVIVLGSPVYYSYPTGVMRAFMERMMFPIGTYMYEKPEGEENGHLGRHICNTYQFNDYSRYDFNLFSEEDKRKYRDEHFAIDLQNAYELGKRLVEKVQ